MSMYEQVSANKTVLEKAPWDEILLSPFEEEVRSYLLRLREKIIDAFESLEPSHSFNKTRWNHIGEHKNGGGEMGVIRGEYFEKAAVNFSCVGGDQFPMQDGKGSFVAMGVSLITHMKNPKAPTVHFNLRRIITETTSWFAGGYDLTPMGFPFAEDTEHFHQVAKKSLNNFGTFGESYYTEFKKNAQNYFYIPHRKKERGIGGIFFDHFQTENPSQDFAMFQSIGDHFLEAIMPIYKKRVSMPYNEADIAIQTELRSHYVEFNLLYDRGTKFGFASGGNPEAILCSLPPKAGW